MAYIDIDISEYIEEFSTDELKAELTRREERHSDSQKPFIDNGYKREVLRTFNELLESNPNLIELNKELQNLIKS